MHAGTEEARSAGSPGLALQVFVAGRVFWESVESYAGTASAFNQITLSPKTQNS